MVKRLNDNARKKYELFSGEKINKNTIFINKFRILNKKPVSIKYKNISLLGNKLKILVNRDSDSQKLAFTVLACGLGEKNTSLGAGFCDWR
jgi:CRISPR-associated endoribonuclease Cas6